MSDRRRKIFKPWVKLHIRLLSNEDVAELPDSSKWRFIECLLLAGEERNRAIEAGEEQDDGYLPTLKRMAYVLRTPQQALQDDLSRLAMAGLMELREHPDGTERWYVTHFIKWQEGTPDAERQRFSRSTRKNEDKKERGRIRIIDEQLLSQQGHNTVTIAAVSPPPPKVISQPVDRTPKGFAGYTPPPEPPNNPPAQRPEEERQAIGALINALVAVTGKAAKLNPDVIAFAEELYPLGYTAPQVLRAYSNQPTTGWNWYVKNWKGRDKGDRPTIKDIRDTIGGAIDDSPKPAKRLSQIDIALGLTTGG